MPSIERKKEEEKERKGAGIALGGGPGSGSMVARPPSFGSQLASAFKSWVVHFSELPPHLAVKELGLVAGKGLVGLLPFVAVTHVLITVAERRAPPPAGLRAPAFAVEGKELDPSERPREASGVAGVSVPGKGVASLDPAFMPVAGELGAEGGAGTGDGAAAGAGAGAAAGGPQAKGAGDDALAAAMAAAKGQPGAAGRPALRAMQGFGASQGSGSGGGSSAGFAGGSASGSGGSGEGAALAAGARTGAPAALKRNSAGLRASRLSKSGAQGSRGSIRQLLSANRFSAQGALSTTGEGSSHFTARAFDGQRASGAGASSPAGDIARPPGVATGGSGAGGGGTGPMPDMQGGGTPLEQALAELGMTPEADQCGQGLIAVRPDLFKAKDSTPYDQEVQQVRDLADQSRSTRNSGVKQIILGILAVVMGAAMLGSPLRSGGNPLMVAATAVFNPVALFKVIADAAQAVAQGAFKWPVSAVAIPIILGGLYSIYSGYRMIQQAKSMSNEAKSIAADIETRYGQEEQGGALKKCLDFALKGKDCGGSDPPSRRSERERAEKCGFKKCMSSDELEAYSECLAKP